MLGVRTCIHDHEVRSVISYVMTKYVGGISVVRKQLKFFNVIFIGLLYFRMLVNIIIFVLDANSWVGSVEEM